MTTELAKTGLDASDLQRYTTVLGTDSTRGAPMLQTDMQHTQVDNRSAQPPVRCLDLDLRPNGWTDRIRLSGCTFADVIRLCAGSVWKQHPDRAEREFLATPAMQTIKDQPIEALELKLYEDGSIEQISLAGCTAEQALQFCRLIVEFDALADNHWLDPDDEHEDNEPRCAPALPS